MQHANPTPNVVMHVQAAAHRELDRPDWPGQMQGSDEPRIAQYGCQQRGPSTGGEARLQEETRSESEESVGVIRRMGEYRESAVTSVCPVEPLLVLERTIGQEAIHQQ